jgi:hypothetical protein
LVDPFLIGANLNGMQTFSKLRKATRATHKFMKRTNVIQDGQETVAYTDETTDEKATRNVLWNFLCHLLHKGCCSEYHSELPNGHVTALLYKTRMYRDKPSLTMLGTAILELVTIHPTQYQVFDKYFAERKRLSERVAAMGVDLPDKLHAAVVMASLQSMPKFKSLIRDMNTEEQQPNYAQVVQRIRDVEITDRQGYQFDQAMRGRMPHRQRTNNDRTTERKSTMREGNDVRANKTRAEGAQKLCHFYGKGDGCRRGADCGFEHIEPKMQDSKNSNKEEKIKCPACNKSGENAHEIWNCPTLPESVRRLMNQNGPAGAKLSQAQIRELDDEQEILEVMNHMTKVNAVNIETAQQAIDFVMNQQHVKAKTSEIRGKTNKKRVFDIMFEIDSACNFSTSPDDSDCIPRSVRRLE